MKKSKDRMGCETLETRHLMTVWGVPWPEPEKISVSFAPDGTIIEGQQSQLFSKLDATFSRQGWQQASLLALQTWAKYANLNFFESSDLGSPFGSVSGAQGQPQSGDIRIGSVPLAATELAVASPFDIFSDWSGEMILNASTQFSLNGGTGYDLFTALLQEAGHALSLPPTNDPTSVMFGDYTGRKFDLTPQDISAIRRLYGARKADRFEGTAGNNVFANATQISFVADVDQYRGLDPQAGSTPFIASADLTHMNDVDFYRFVVPQGSNDFHVILRTSDVSLLTSSVKVYDASQRLVAQHSAVNPQAGDIQLFVSGAVGGSNYFVRIEGVGGKAFEIGSYRLAVGHEAQEAVFPSVPSYINDDIGDDDDGVDTIVPLAPKTTGVGVPWDYSHRASLSFSTDEDVYRIVAPANITASHSLIASVWALEPDKLEPRVRVYATSALTSPMASEIIRNDEGAFAVQIRNLLPGRSYFLKVDANDPKGSHKEGNYLLAADFRPEVLVLRQFAAGWVNQQNYQQLFGLRNDRTQVHHIRLSLVQPAGFAKSIAARLTIYDANRQVVDSFIAETGEDGTTSVLLQPGEYTLRVVAAVDDGSPLPVVNFRISGTVLTDPIGPTRVSPGTAPPTGVYPSNYWYYYYYYLRNRYASWLSGTDPYASPR